VLENLALVVEVKNPSGQVIFTTRHAIAQLPPGALRDFDAVQTFIGAPSGQYTVEQKLVDSQERAYDTQSASYEVVASTEAGSGLVGTLQASPKNVASGDAVTFNWSATNKGNALLSGLPLKVSVLDVNAQAVVAEFPYSTDLNVSSAYTAVTSWPAAGASGTTYAAVLSATVGGNVLTLASDTFTVTAKPIKLDVKQTISGQSRVLVLYDCSPYWHLSDPTWKPGKHVNPCFAERNQALETLLTSLAVQHTITNDQTVFTKELRSGAYNAIWLIGAIEAINADVVKEIREAVYRGATLLEDGGLHVWNNDILYKTAGVKYTGKLTVTPQIMTVNGPLYTPVQLTTVGKPLRFALSGGDVQGTYTVAYVKSVESDDDDDDDGDYDEDDEVDSDRDDDDDDECDDDDEVDDDERDDDERDDDEEDDDETCTVTTVYKQYPSIASRAYGHGKALAFGFDFLEALKNGAADAAKWRVLIDQSMAFLQPQDMGSTAADFARVLTTVTNQAQSTDVKVVATLPAGSSFVSALPNATASGNTVTWSFNLAESAVWALDLGLRLPAATGTYAMSTEVSTVKAGQATVWGTYPLSFTVTDALPAAQAALTKLKSLSLSGTQGDYLYAAKTALNSGINQYKSNYNRQAIGYLAQAAYKLKQITKVDLSAERLAIDKLLEQAEYRWFVAPN